MFGLVLGHHYPRSRRPSLHCSTNSVYCGSYCICRSRLGQNVTILQSNTSRQGILPSSVEAMDE